MSGNVTRGWVNSRIQATKVCKTETDVTSSTVLVPISGLSHKLLEGGTYTIECRITGTAGGSGGAKVALVGDGVLTATMFSATATNMNGTTANARSTTTTLGNAIGASTAVFTDIIILGAITVGVGGTISVEIAQNASNGTATSALVGSFLKVTPVT